MLFGYFLSAAIMTAGEDRPRAPELARRMTMRSCRLDPARALAPVLTAMPAAGIPLGDIPDNSGYAHRDAQAWAIPLRRAGAQLVQDLHPHDRGPRGTHHGAIIANGNLYCPQTPRTLLKLAPLRPAATAEQATGHDQQTTELSRYKLSRHTNDDTDSYHRATCPAITGKTRCPHRPEPMKLPRDRPEILTPPGHPPACCTQQTITIGPDVAAKTRQKHHYPSPAQGRSYRRRTSAERGFSTIKDPASNNTSRGWCRQTGLIPLTLRIACLLAVRNQRTLAAYHARQQDNTRRAASGLPPRTRKHRRTTLSPSSPPGRPNQPSSPTHGTPAGPTATATPVPPGPTSPQRPSPPRTPPNKTVSAPSTRTSAPDVNINTGDV